jgi:hypothetical protein
MKISDIKAVDITIVSKSKIYIESMKDFVLMQLKTLFIMSRTKVEIECGEMNEEYGEWKDVEISFKFIDTHNNCNLLCCCNFVEKHSTTQGILFGEGVIMSFNLEDEDGIGAINTERVREMIKEENNN